MSEHVYKVVQVVGSSPDDVESAIDNALDKAQDTIRNMRWFEVDEIRGHIEDGTVNHYQVSLKVGFTLD